MSTIQGALLAVACILVCTFGALAITHYAGDGFPRVDLVIPGNEPARKCP